MTMHSESALEATLQTTDPSTTTYSTLDDTSDNTLSGGGKLNVTRDDLERRQLLHNLQLLKLEVSQKNLVIDTLKADHAAQLEDLQERLSDSLHEKQLAQARLKSLSQAHDAELRRVRERSQQETSVLAARMKELEEANPFVGGQEQDIRQALTGPGLSELEYSRLRAKDSDSLSLKDYIMVSYLYGGAAIVQTKDFNPLTHIPHSILHTLAYSVLHTLTLHTQLHTHSTHSHSTHSHSTHSTHSHSTHSTHSHSTHYTHTPHTPHTNTPHPYGFWLSEGTLPFPKTHFCCCF